MSQFYVNGSSGGGGGGIIETIAGDTGSITGANVTIYAGNSTNTSGASIEFINSGTVSTLKTTDSLNNVFLGNLAGNTTVSGANNNSQGRLALASVTSGDSNSSFGSTSLTNLQDGSFNTAVGVIAGQNIVSGNNNVLLGRAAGQNYTSSESNNICIGASVTGTVAENNTTRIGNNSASSCYVQGIAGVTTTNTNLVTINTATGQLGSTAVPSSIQTIAGDTGSITGSNVTIYANNATNNSGASVQFVNSGTVSSLNVTDASGNTNLGRLSGNLAVVGSNNSSFGLGALRRIAISQNNTAIGSVSLNLLTNSTGSNTAVGVGSLGAITTGALNTAIGEGSGGNYTSSESSNISIGYEVKGTVGESNVLRIGTNGSLSGQQNKAFIAGIAGVTVANSQIVTIDSNSQLGSIPNNSFVNSIKSTLIDFKTVGATPIFTTTGNFLITNIIFQAQTITGTSATATVNFGWTATTYSDFATGIVNSTTTSLTYQPKPTGTAITAPLPLVPNATTFQVNVTVADTTATQNSGYIIIQGLYV